MALILSVLIFLHQNTIRVFILMLLVVNWIFFLLFLLLRKWEPVEKEPNFSARSDQYSSVAIFTDFANLSVKFPFSLIF